MATGEPITAVITGASSGIGAATAHRIAREPGARLVLVARREEQLRSLATELPAPTTYVAVDLTGEEAPRQVREHLEAEQGGRITLLVNNAGAAWRSTFEEGGWPNVQRTMALDFDSVVRLTGELLPLLRRSSPSQIVNVTSTAARISRPGSGAYNAAKAALAAWTDSLHLEERRNGVHVGQVLPGFIETEGFPATELLAKPWTRWIVSEPEKAAEAIYEAGPGGKAERYVPRPYWLAAAARLLTPAITRRVLSAGQAGALTTSTRPDAD